MLAINSQCHFGNASIEFSIFLLWILFLFTFLSFFPFSQGSAYVLRLKTEVRSVFCEG